MMVHSLSFPKEDGSFICNARGIYYPITTDDMSNGEAEDVDVFQCIEKIRNHILANQKLKVAVPEMEGIGGVMFERIKYLFVNTNVEVRMYKPANSQKKITHGNSQRSKHNAGGAYQPRNRNKMQYS
ncbi:hypothetical protein JTB14_016918 [Gonioctena quinquepunctata]|nr:hypothetical protein JTB14_016918 [Gonioctena quinquepunctata]